MTVSPNGVDRSTKKIIYYNPVCVVFIFDDYSEAFLLHNDLFYLLVSIAIMVHVTISMRLYIYESRT